MKRILITALAAVFLLCMPAYASVEEGFDTREQLDALGREELMDNVPEEARELMEETGTYDLSVDNLLHLSPKDFFKAIWKAFVTQIKKPMVTFSAMVGVMILCALLNSMKTSVGGDSMGQIFGVVCALCILTSVVVPVLDCILDTTKAIQDASFFMLSFIPMLSAALMAAGQPATGAAYNLFLFSTCQVVSQVVAQTLIPLMGIYLAFCIVGSLVPDLNITSATASIKSVVSWALGFLLTIFVGLLSVQTLVSSGADTVTTRTAKFLIGSFVPVVGSALSEAFVAAQGCLRLIKTTVGAYGIIVALFTFLPIFLQTLAWYMVTNLGVVVSDIIGVSKVSAMLKSCSSVLGILIAIILCYALLIVVSTTVVMLTGMGAA